MNELRNIRTYLLALGLVVILQPRPGLAQSGAEVPEPAPRQQAETLRDGQHDFDFEIGNWKTHLSRLVHPLTGSKTW
ncbi:MAG: hypothetical protein WCE26_23945, partial [Candidatus Acidiferrales bacterium]